jgi:hypothetical protein
VEQGSAMQGARANQICPHHASCAARSGAEPQNGIASGSGDRWMGGFVTTSFDDLCSGSTMSRLANTLILTARK